MTAPLFSRTHASLGEFALRPVDPAGDAELLHGWVTHPKAVYWMMQDADLAAVEAEFARIDADPYHDAFIGLHNGVPAFLMERYDPAHREVTEVHEAAPGDIGMHFLTAPTDTPVHGFTLAVITTVMDALFAEPGTRRVVVEPAVGNTAVHALNKAVGFEIERTVTLPKGEAYLSTCTRDQFLAARGENPC
ncbi:GNAT family N-acetyltransferase [Streptomyces chrestomyceticus]|uniref:Lysine N-acyltransferase MbtK n=1 Tax=Streptomyces chrestomyceticus TaxID=68185 RepID=A0ABU7WXI9_9ACTN